MWKTNNYPTVMTLSFPLIQTKKKLINRYDQHNKAHNMLKVVRYTYENAQEWDGFVEGSKNGTFLFMRAYMDYHSDRFKDHSLMIYDCNESKTRLVGLLPANEKDTTLYSHQGLTYGGLVLSRKAHIAEVGEIFTAIKDYLRGNGFRKLIYKQIPKVYHTLPSEEDEYWLWQHNATKVGCAVMTAVDLYATTNGTTSSRKGTTHNKLVREGYKVVTDAPITDFWPLLTSNLMERFNAKPVHSLDEILRLQSAFPKNIRCCTVVSPTGETIAGTLLFISKQVVRTQYISASHEGKLHNALDLLMPELIAMSRKNDTYRYFDFGTSMATDGESLNTGLLQQKEGFGGRSIACNVYSIDISEDGNGQQTS